MKLSDLNFVRRSLNRFDYNFDFMSRRARRRGFIFSFTLIGIAVISLLVQGLKFGIDFTGGTLVEAHYSQSIELQDLRNSLHQNGFADAVLQHYGTTQDVLIRLGLHDGMKNEELNAKIMGVLQKTGQVELRRVEFVGPQVGGELITGGVLALALTLLGILVYVASRFEFRFSTGAIAALLHDVIITVGVFSVFRLEFDLTVLAAVLTVVGYSINDTIVVYDRIRDNFLKLRKKTSEEVMNISINQTLSRTVMTSVATLLTVVVLFFNGGEMIHGFSLALLVGIGIGTYSSIYIASAYALMLGVNRADLLPVQKEGVGLDNNP
jgi:preprotein translocase subunit SecF